MLNPSLVRCGSRDFSGCATKSPQSMAGEPAAAKRNKHKGAGKWKADNPH
jgi:hypothetical protein